MEPINILTRRSKSNIHFRPCPFKHLKMNRKLYGIFLFFLVVFWGCKKSDSMSPASTNNSNSNNVDSVSINSKDSIFAKGADVSWLTQMEASGYKFYDTTGQQKDCLQILKEKGINAIRLRAWVNPSDGWCGTADVLNKAVRAHNLGFNIMIDFHYSDTWADPGHQTKPAAWVHAGTPALIDSVYQYTYNVLSILKKNGITPKWIQIGNETNNGMLWPDGMASINMGTFAKMINAGYNAAKAVDSSIQVIVHISNGYDNSLFRWVFDGLKSNDAHWDIIGMSLYPGESNWQSLDSECLANMQDMISRYNKKVMICEVGMSWTDSLICRQFLTDIINKVKSLPGHNGLGVFYWEPECYNWVNYTLGAFNTHGEPTSALDAFE